MAVAYLFPGQGFPNLAGERALYEQSAAVRKVYDDADRFLGYSLSALCFADDVSALAATDVQQPALYVAGLARWAYAQEQGWPRAGYLAGHSMGEITALAAAQSLTFFAGLHLVRERGRLMHGMSEGGMIALLGLDLESAERLTDQAAAETGAILNLSNDNAPMQQVVSGEEVALERVTELAHAGGARVIRLPIPMGSHCALMRAVSAEFKTILDDTPVNSPKIPVISNLTAEPLPAPRRIRDELSRQLLERVRWRESMLTLRGRGVERFVEIGPGDKLSGLMKRIDRKATRQTFEQIYSDQHVADGRM
jgi:[acyl-carrier-protein] S-malonyltransferase